MGLIPNIHTKYDCTLHTIQKGGEISIKSPLEYSSAKFNWTFFFLKWENKIQCVPPPTPPEVTLVTSHYYIKRTHVANFIYINIAMQNALNYLARVLIILKWFGRSIVFILNFKFDEIKTFLHFEIYQMILLFAFLFCHRKI